MIIASARAEDESAIRRLLELAELPTSDLTPAGLKHFQVLREGSLLAGVVGLEIDGSVALLRSLAVDPARRSCGAGAELVAAAEAYARKHDVRVIYLLTTTADGFFVTRGYRPVEREQAPVAIRRSAQFREICPASSTLMAKYL